MDLLPPAFGGGFLCAGGGGASYFHYFHLFSPAVKDESENKKWISLPSVDFWRRFMSKRHNVNIC
jgi:hypothetical protein